jgi:PknH-like extracellular domain
LRRRSRFARCAVLPIVLALLASGCTEVAAGRPRAARELKPRSLTGDTVEKVLLDGERMSKILRQDLSTIREPTTESGGPERLSALRATFSPADCVGPVTVRSQAAYGSANVQRVASRVWILGGGAAGIMTVAEDVVALPDTADANALFATFTDQWKRCNGTTVTSRNDSSLYRDMITSVRVVDSLLDATITSTAFPATQPSSGIPVRGAHAVGVRVNCLVEMNITVLGRSSSLTRGNDDIAVQVDNGTREMMAEVSALS